MKFHFVYLWIYVGFVKGWNYLAQTSWPSKCSSGTSQSPIAISEIGSLEESEIRYILEYTSYNPAIPARVMDNGHYLVAYLLTGTGTMLVRGLASDMPLEFSVRELRFSAPSEHSIGGKFYDLEMQIVHKIETQYLPPDGSLSSKKLAISIFFSASSNENNTMINSLNLNTFDTISNLNLKEYFETLQPRYIFYEGSLSAPPCTEGVYHFLMIDAQSISGAQLKEFTNFYSNNSRNIQSLNSRSVVKVTKLINRNLENAAAELLPGMLILLAILLTVLL